MLHGRPEDLASGRFDLVGEVRELGDPADWEQLNASRLWRFELHYFEWAWALAAAKNRVWARTVFAGLWYSWSANTTPGRGDGWAPYVVSLRAWVLCDVFGVLVAGSNIESTVIDELYRHARFIRTHLELDIGGNHLLKNLKALVGLGVFLGDSALVDRARRLITDQLPIQVLADGGHFERSPSYHCQVLGDLLDVAGLLAESGEQPPAELDNAIGRMQCWLGVMVGADGEVPLVNDAVPVGVERLARMTPIATNQRLVVLESSGYVVARPDERTQVVMDVGDPCPDELPGHAHADCLSFELWVDGKRVIVDTGTSTYAAGPRRAHERSTAAHNTVEIDEVDQTEVWGTFRAGRRARGTLVQATDDGRRITVTATHNGYRFLSGSPIHRRTWTVSSGRLQVADEIHGRGPHRVVSRLYAHTSSSAVVEIEGRGGRVSTHPCTTAWGFGRSVPATEVRLEPEFCELPTYLGWLLEWT